MPITGSSPANTQVKSPGWRGCLVIFLLIILVFAGIGAYSYWVEPGWVQVVNHTLAVPGLDREASGLRLVQISDIHIDDWMNEQRVEKVIDLVNQQQPDIILLTGDFIYQHASTSAPIVAQVLSELNPRLVTLGILGNHDHYAWVGYMRGALATAGVRELRNQVYPVQINNKTVLYIGGVDDPESAADNIDQVLQGMTESVPAILLAHEPDFAPEYAATGRFFLQLSGHTHGGQVRFPLIGAITLPEYGKLYQAGFYQVGSMRLYVNRGIGSIPWHIRLNDRPEITVFELHPASE